MLFVNCCLPAFSQRLGTSLFDGELVIQSFAVRSFLVKVLHKFTLMQLIFHIIFLYKDGGFMQLIKYKLQLFLSQCYLDLLNSNNSCYIIIAQTELI